MKQVEASAKTREEAIQSALKDLGVEMYEVDKIEVLDEGSKGLFGFGSRPVKVRLVVENMPDDPQRNEAEEERPRRNTRGRGGRNQDRGARGERKETSSETEGQTKEKTGEREGRGRNNRDGKGRNDRNNRGRTPRTENTNSEEQSAESTSTSSERPRGNRGERGDRDTTRKTGETPRSRGARNRGDRDARPERETTPRAENDETPVQAKAPQEEGLVADIIEPITDAQGSEAASLLEEIITQMGIEAKATFTRSDDGSARLNVSSEDSAILIGRKGRNLSAMQYLINRMISRGDTNENTERLVVDVEGYVDRRRESLQDMARSMAERAKESQRNMRLKPLSPQERRIIHLALQEDDDIRTFSLGDSLYRSVVISPKGAPQPERGRNNRNNRGGRRRGGRDRSQDSRGGQKRGNEQDIDVGTFGD